jgi:hypothetical protein
MFGADVPLLQVCNGADLVRDEKIAEKFEADIPPEGSDEARLNRVGVTWITSTGWNNAMVGVREQQRTQSEGDMADTKNWFAVFSAIMMGALMLAFVVMVQPLPV